MDQIKAPAIAVIGCGYWGKNLVRNFAQLGVLGMVCDMTKAGRHTAAQLAPGVPVVADLAAVWASPAQAVVVATPAETHYAVVRAALEAGKDIFVEKPLALTYEQGAEMVALSERQGRILMVGHVLDISPRDCVPATTDPGGRTGQGTIYLLEPAEPGQGAARRKHPLELCPS